jgi:copper chaperone CopZ
VDDAFTVPLQILHLSPGRIRLRVSTADFASSELVEVERVLAKLPGVREVRKNPLARSVVISFDPEDATVESLLAVIEGVGVSLKPPPEIPPAHPLGESITTFFRHADERVHRRTGGAADLRTLVPVGLTALAIREIVAGRAVAAPWYALLWYAFSSFHSLRKSEETQNHPRG